uniref:Uncharacterized protein n=1 Tax=Hordeum vulgare subsp. vulgare TaxID=112509 RepID=A0A8I7B7W9_HORVV
MEATSAVLERARRLRTRKAAIGSAPSRRRARSRRWSSAMVRRWNLEAPMVSLVWMEETGGALLVLGATLYRHGRLGPCHV